MDDKKEGMNNTAPQAVVDTAKGAKELAGNTLSGAVSGSTRKQPTRKRQKSKSVSGPTKRGSSKRSTSTSATAKRGSPKRRSASTAAKKTATKPQSKAVKVGRAPSAKSRRTPAKADELSSLWPPANELLEKIALAEAEKATDAAHKHAQAEAEKSDQLSKTLGISDEEVMKSAAALVEQAVRAGLTEVQVYRFPNTLCTDHGRAINQQEPGWEDTLTGVPKQLYQFWHKSLRPRGYKLRAQIVDFPGGLPGKSA
jgi:hypothetical protein